MGIYKIALPVVIAGIIGGCATILEELDSALGGNDSSGSESRSSGIEIQPDRRSTPSTVTDDGPFRGELAGAEERIFDLVNEERTRRGLHPLRIRTDLAVVARQHSEDMGVRDYYSHVDPDGVTPHERITAALADTVYIEGTSENIAFTESSRGFSHQDYNSLARQLMTGWMNSSGHRANILREDSTHVGIGLVRSGNRIYATQKFMSYVAERDSEDDNRMAASADPTVRLKINPALDIPRSDFVVRVALPDASARWTSDSGTSYVGVAFPELAWIDETTVELTLPVDYGSGIYSLHLGTQGGNRTSTTAFEYSVE